MLIQIVFTLLFAGALLVTWRRAGRQVISRGEALLWSTLWIAAGFVLWRPETTSVLARIFGVGRGVDLVLYISIVLLFWLVFRLFIRTDMLERQLSDLVRHDAVGAFFAERTKDDKK